MAITSKSTLTQSFSPIYELNRTVPYFTKIIIIIIICNNTVCKLFVLDRNTW